METRVDNNQAIDVLITVSERGFGNRVVKLYKSYNIHAHHISAGHGSASSEILQSLGIGSSEKDIVFSFGSEDRIKALMNELGGELGHHMGFRGIAIALKFTGMNRMAAEAITITEENSPTRASGGIAMEYTQDKKNSLLLISVNFGYTDDVMCCARANGATGGTIIRSRWVGSEDIEKIHGFNIQKEREMILIVADSEKRNAIMNEVNNKFGLKTDAHAIICSLPVERAVLLA